MGWQFRRRIPLDGGAGQQTPTGSRRQAKRILINGAEVGAAAAAAEAKIRVG